MVTERPCELTVARAAIAIAARALTSLQLVESCLERIDRLEGQIQSWALVDREGAIEAARRLDNELQQGQRRGPLHGVPFGIKDIFYTAGLPTEAGSRVCSGFLPPYDATPVARLKAAGAVILGKTRTTEFAYLDPTVTRNPWNLDHTPGGSSSGSAAAVAAGMCLAALGSQTLGSVLRPAAYNGLVGFKPHYGRISTYGVIPSSWTLDHVGILGRSVEDMALVFQAMAGYDSKSHHSLVEAVPDCLGNLETKKAPHLGLVKQYFFEHADEEMRLHVESVAKSLHQAGAEVREIELPSSFSDIQTNGRVILAAEVAAYHQQMFADRQNDYGTAIGRLIEEGFAIPATEYARALEKRLQQYADVRPVLIQVDALLTPGAPSAAPYSLARTGNPVMQAPWTIMGIPTISLPTGLNKDGLPLAIQLVGAPLTEDRLLSVARWCERVLDRRFRPPLVQ